MALFSNIFGRVASLSSMGMDVVPLAAIEDPIHAERMERYKRNLNYYLQAQYDDINAPLFMSTAPSVWSKARVNYTGVIQQTVDTKADWLYGEPPQTQFVAIAHEEQEPDASEGEKSQLVALEKRIMEIRRANELDYWEWMAALTGMVCGDYFWYGYVDPETAEVHCDLIDPLLVFPLYSKNLAIKLLPALQMRFLRGAAGSDESILVVRDWRLAPQRGWDRAARSLDELTTVPDEMLKGAGPDTLTCIHRKFEEGKLVQVENLGIKRVPWVHGINQQWGRSRFGLDEVSALIPKVEKYNDLMRYAERIARVNANAKLGIVGARPGKLKADADDVIYFPEGSSAQVISLPADTSVLNFIKTELKDTMYKDAAVPQEALGEGEMGSNLPALSLELKFQRLVQITRRHRNVYSKAMKERDALLLELDENFGQGSLWSEQRYEEEFVWYDAMPKSRTAAITDGALAAPGKQLVSTETIQGWIPGVDPNKEGSRLESEQQASQQAMLAQQQALMMGAEQPPGEVGVPGYGGEAAPPEANPKSGLSQAGSTW